MISVIMPAFNEVERVAETVTAVRRLMEHRDAELIVVDDGSTDDTAEAAGAAGADIVVRQRNSGKGAALTAGARAARGDVLLLLDADLGATALDAIKLLEPVLAGDADMTIARFPIVPGRGGGMGLVVRLARRGIRALTGRTMAAPLSGQRALRRSVLDAGGGFASGWGVEVALTVRALWAGFRVMEIETLMDHRVTGRTVPGTLHRAAQFRGALDVLIRLALWRVRNRRSLPKIDARRGR